jgi:hypothetical protein
MAVVDRQRGLCWADNPLLPDPGTHADDEGLHGE